LAARGFAAPPLAEEDEMAFQQLWEMWEPRERFYPRGALAKSREAFAAICIKHGDEIRTTYGMEPRDFILARAKFWLDGIESPKFLKTLEAWLGGAPDSQGRTDHFWLREPTAPTHGRRGSKTDLLKVALRGAARAAS
jgi:hypothetical protein